MVLRSRNLVQRRSAISFDLGQTLVELDDALLVEQANSQNFLLPQSRVAGELAPAWQAYNLAKSQSQTGYAAWSAFMIKLLQNVGMSHQDGERPVSASEREQFVRYLWSEQPHRNLWRKPIAGIRELLIDLVTAAIPVGVLTNSEGRAKELVDQVGFGSLVKSVVDSGLEGVEKPDPRIFHTLSERLGFPPEDIIHVGDSYEADVLGALGVGMTPIWFTGEASVTLPPGVFLCHSVAELRRVLLPD